MCARVSVCVSVCVCVCVCECMFMCPTINYLADLAITYMLFTPYTLSNL